MIRKMVVVVAGLLLLTPTFAFARAHDDEAAAAGMVSAVDGREGRPLIGDVELGAVADETVLTLYIPDLRGGRTGIRDE